MDLPRVSGRFLFFYALAVGFFCQLYEPARIVGMLLLIAAGLILLYKTMKFVDEYKKSTKMLLEAVEPEEA